MRNRIAAIALLSLLFQIALASGQEQPASFKLYQARPEIPPGTTFDFTQSSEIERAAMTVGDVNSEPVGHSWNSYSRMLSWRDLGPDKFAMVLGGSKMSTSVQIVGQEKSSFSPDVEDSLEGAKLLFERVDEKWHTKLIGREPTAEERKYLASVTAAIDEQDLEDEKIYGEREFKVGDTLKIDSPILPMTTLADTKITASATLKIDRIEKIDGVPCAVLTGSVQQTGESTHGHAVADVTLTGKVTIWRSIDYSMDLKVESDATMQRVERDQEKKKKRATTGPLKIRIRTKVRQ